MKGIVLRGAGKLELENVNMPEADEGEIVIKVKSSAICGTDLRMAENGYPGINEMHPRILGHEFGGEIVQAGRGVENYHEHMRVIAAPNLGCGTCSECIEGNTHLCRNYQALGIQLDGAFAEYVKIPKRAVCQGNVMEVPDGTDISHAALCEPLSCVYNGLEKCRIKLGDTVLVMGAGPIGLLHASLAKVLGAGRILIYDPDSGRARQARQVDKSFRVTCKNLEALGAWILQESGGRGADVCITACPAPAAQQASLGFMAVGGRVCFFGGLPASKEMVTVNTNLIHYRELKVVGSTRSNLRQFSEMLKLIKEKKIDLTPFITGKYAVEEYKEAFLAAGCGRGIKNIINF